MGAIASQITSLTIVYSTDYSDVDHQRKHQISASLASVRVIHREPVTRKKFPFDVVIMIMKWCNVFANSGFKNTIIDRWQQNNLNFKSESFVEYRGFIHQRVKMTTCIEIEIESHLALGHCWWLFQSAWSWWLRVPVLIRGPFKYSAMTWNASADFPREYGLPWYYMWIHKKAVSFLIYVNFSVIYLKQLIALNMSNELVLQTSLSKSYIYLSMGYLTKALL